MEVCIAGEGGGGVKILGPSCKQCTTALTLTMARASSRWAGSGVFPGALRRCFSASAEGIMPEHSQVVTLAASPRPGRCFLDQ